VFLGGLVGRPPATLEKRIPINITKVERTMSGTLIHVEEAREYEK
jgi:hypothetical protein